MTVVCHRVEQLGLNVALQLLVGVPLEMVHGATRIGLVYVAGVVAGRQGPLWRSSPGKVRGDPRGDQAQASPELTGLHLTQNCPVAYFPQLPRQGGMFWKGGRACDWDRPLTEFLSSTCHVPAVEAWGNSLVPFGSIKLVDRANESCLLLLGGCPCNERLLPLCNTQEHPGRQGHG